METVTQVTEAASGSPFGTVIGLLIVVGIGWAFSVKKKTGKWPWTKK